jgi:membrane protein implicated in regulation of membrane protease activity
MPKELVLSIVFLGIFLLAFVWGLIDTSVLSNLLFLVVAVACIIGHVVTAHLAYNQFKNVTEPETVNEDDEDERKEKGSGNGFDD